MENHKATLVPIESWLYNSPKILLNGTRIDMGLVCEALVYYDRVYIDIQNRDHFNEIIRWFQSQGCFKDFLSLLEDRAICFSYHSFLTSPIYDPAADVYHLYNIDDDGAKEKEVFFPRIVYNVDLNKLTNNRERQKLYKAVEGNFLEFKADKFSESIENARFDYSNPELCTVLVQSFVDELYRDFGYAKRPVIESKIAQDLSQDKKTLSWNIDFKSIDKKTNGKLNIHKGIPIAGIAHCNRLITTASFLGSDLYLGNVMSSLANNKLLELESRKNKVAKVIFELKNEVEFPKISDLVNVGKLKFPDILFIRKRASKFRSWLQTEGEKDRNAIFAYHQEVSKSTGLDKFGKHSISFSGAALGGFAGLLAGDLINNQAAGAVLGATLNETIKSFTQSLNQDWKPIVFGDWLTKYVE